MTVVQVDGRDYAVREDLEEVRERLFSRRETRLGFAELALDDGGRLLVRPDGVTAIWERTWE